MADSNAPPPPVPADPADPAAATVPPPAAAPAPEQVLAATAAGSWAARTLAAAPPSRPEQTIRAAGDETPTTATDATMLPSASVTYPLEAATGLESAAAAATSGATFRVLRTLGQGGMGVVYAAEQGSLKREVALKMVLPGTAARAEAEARFAAEAVVTGRLDHPNIVSVHDLGRDAAGSLFISMKLVRGLGWDRLLHPRPGDPPEVSERAARLHLRDHLDILLRVCDAVAFAHSHAIVHRDLKPENVMVGEFGEILVMDWGLALDISPDARRARGEGARSARGPSGTPRYMSPELALGELERISPATDVYLLGAILYEVLTGAPPHQGESIHIVLLAASKGEVEPASQRAPDRPIPRSLEAVAARALAPEPEDRYQAVTDFARAVRDFLRNEASLELSAAAIAQVEQQELVIADPGVAPAEVYGALAASIAELQQALKLWSGNEVARTGLTRAYFAYANAALERGDLELAETQLAHAAAGTPRQAELARAIVAARAARAREARRRRWLFGGLAAAVVVAGAIGVHQWQRAAEARKRAEQERVAAQMSLARLFHEMALSSLANAEARMGEVLFARALTIDDRADSRQGLLRARNATARVVWTSPIESGSTAIAFAPGGAAVAAVGSDGRVRVVEVPSGRERTLLPPLGAEVNAVAYGPEGRLLAAALVSGEVVVVDVEAGRELHRLAAHEGRAWGVAISPDGRRLASCGEDRAVRLFDLERGRDVAVQRLHEATVYGLAFRPNGRELVSASWDSTLRTWDAETLAPLREVKQEVGWMFRPVYSPDGDLVAAGNDQTTITLNQADSGELLLTLRGHDRGVESLAFSPDGLRLVTGSGDSTVRVWDLRTARVLLTMRARRMETQGFGVAWSPSGRYLALAGFDKRLSFWDLEGEREAAILRGHERAAAGVRFSPDGRRLASSAWDKTVRIWDVETRRQLRVIRAHEDQVEEIAWGQGGRYVASGGWDKTARVFDAETGAEVRVFRGHQSWIAAVDLSPDERLLASASEDGTVRLWDIERGEALGTWTGHVGGVLCVAVSPDGRRVASGGADKTVRIWDAARGVEVLRLEGHEADVEGVAWSPDGARLATGSWDRTVRIWDAATGRLLRTHEGHDGWVYGVQWSRDGRRVASASEDMTVRVWDALGDGASLELVGHTGEVQTCAFDPTGRLVASASYDGTVRIWYLDRLEQFFAMAPEALAAEAETHTGLGVDSLDPLAVPGASGGGGGAADE